MYTYVYVYTRVYIYMYLYVYVYICVFIRCLSRACPAGVARVENLVDTVSKTGFKGTLAFMSPEQLEVDTCWVPQQPLREQWRSVGCAGCPRDDQVRRLCFRRLHVGDGDADASVARPRIDCGMRRSALAGAGYASLGLWFGLCTAPSTQNTPCAH